MESETPFAPIIQSVVKQERSKGESIHLSANLQL